MARMTKEQKLFETRVDRIIQRTINGWQINVMSLSTISNAAKAAARLSNDDAEVVKAINEALVKVGATKTL